MVNYRQQTGANDQAVEIDPSANPLQATLYLNVSAMVISDSWIPYRLDKVYVDVSMKTANGDLKQVATGQSPASITVPTRDKVRVYIPTTVIIRGQVNDPVVQTVLRSCGVAGGQRSRIPLRYAVRVDAIGIIKNIKVAENDFSLDCPQQIGDALNQVMNAAKAILGSGGN